MILKDSRLKLQTKISNIKLRHKESNYIYLQPKFTRITVQIRITVRIIYTYNVSVRNIA